ncbi:fungal-specific transcription factor domain-containing protein [Mycena polygramma]|nr:fungal-specific transcription factor domain-containing protein [Mycena polygramma]
MKRSRGIMACAECQRRKLKCDKNFPCSSCVRRGRADVCPTGDVGPIGRGRRCPHGRLPDDIEIIPRLNSGTTIRSMRDPTQQLENSITEADAAGGHDSAESTLQHPFPGDELLSIKHSSDLPRSCSGSTPAQLAHSCGVLALSALVTPRYFESTAGPSALLSAEGNAGADRAWYAPLFADLANSFPLNCAQTSSWDTITCLETLLRQLPDEARAWALYDIFVADASWYVTPVMPDELHELLVFLYDPNSNLHELSPHTLAVIFLCFASATFADLALPANSPQADTYFDLGRTALTLQPVFGSTDLHTIQALVLTGLYYATGGPRYSLDNSWTLRSMAIGLCQTLNLHCESEYTRLENKTGQRRRALFWEVYSLDTYQSLVFSRPLTIPLADITCEFPADMDQTVDSEGRPVPGFFLTKWKFTTEITAPMAQAFTRATPLTYEEVLDFDRRLRLFMEQAPFPHYYNKSAGETRTFLAYARSHLIPRCAGNLMVYIHRNSFVQALKDPPNPLDGPYGASFLAAYSGATVVIKSDARSLAMYPEHFYRWCPFWKTLVNACFIVGSIVAKSPTAAVAPAALSQLLTAVHLVERGAKHSFVAEGNLPALYRLRNTATAAYSALYPLDVPSQFANPSGQADASDFQMLGGLNTGVQDHSGSVTGSADSPSSTFSWPEMSGVALPSLIPGLMPSPPPSLASPQTPQMPDFWPWSSTFPLEPLVESALTSTSGLASSDRNGNQADQLEADLAAEMLKLTTYNCPCRGGGNSPAAEAEWTRFLRPLEQ